ncbi:hypothetical protein JN080_16805 [Bacillus sp. EB600]|nr:hypothetical protein [Bacillus sp. EB600]
MEKDPNWNWIVCAGAYLPDLNEGAHRVLYVLLITVLKFIYIYIQKYIYDLKKYSLARKTNRAFCESR